MLRKGMFLGDRYEIIEQIGTGGMSDVYKAKCHKLNRFVAIKVLKQEFSEDSNFVSKFIIEAQSAAGLVHPNIVNVYDVGDEEGIHYIVMELVEGITLKRYIEKKGHLSVKEAVSIAIQVAQGMEAAHNHRIIHRDIKPQNIIISKEGKVKVTDFGIARASSSHTINSSAMGSVHYISPEQARGGYSDEKSDVYSFGITLYEMLTGIVPFDGDNTVAVAVRHIQDEITPPSKVMDEIPISVDKIVLKCTQKKPDNRYQNATELITDLKKSLVMPDVDFVKIIPAYAINTDPVKIAPAVGPKNDMPVREDDVIEKEEKKTIKSSIYDELEDDDDFDLLEEDDDNDDGDDDDDVTPVYVPRKKNREDIEDDNNDRIDTIMKWLGIGIAALCVIVIIFVAVKLGGIMGGSGNKQEQTSSVPAETQSSSKETQSIDTSDYVEVPDLKGMTEEEAKKKLNGMNLGCKVTKQPSETVDKGLVISQSEKAETKVPKNTIVTIAISEGNTTIVLEDLVNKTEAEAEEWLKSLGLIVSKDYKYDSKVEYGYVISQLPLANSTLKAGSTVRLVISRGKEEIKVPDVKGMTESDARLALENAGFNGANVKIVWGDAAPSKELSKTVYLQSPKADDKADPDIVISITLYSEYVEPTTEAPTQESTQAPTESQAPAETQAQESTQASQAAETN